MSPEARQFWRGQAVAHRQSGDESGQRRTNEAGLGEPQVAFTAVHSRYQTLGWVRCCFFPARTTHHMIEMQHTSDPQTTWQPLEFHKAQMPAVSLVVMPEFERRSTAAAPVRVVVLGTLCRQRLTAPLSLGAWLLAWPARRTRWRCRWLGSRRSRDGVLLAFSSLQGVHRKMSDDGGFEEFVELLPAAPEFDSSHATGTAVRGAPPNRAPQKRPCSSRKDRQAACSTYRQGI